MSRADSFIGGDVIVYSGEDVEQGANAAILAMDGNLGRDDAKRVARAVLEAAGLQCRSKVLARRDVKALPGGDPGPEMRG